jgi:purine nucleoside permease
MNDSGAMLALQALTNVGKADWNRVLLLRSASNFDRPPTLLRTLKSSCTKALA